LNRVAIVGTTTWGTTLALNLSRNGVPVTILARSQEEAQQLTTAGENSRFLPGAAFPPNLFVTHQLTDALEKASIAILAVPSQSFRKNLKWIKDSLPAESVVLSATKGLEMETGRRMSQVVSEELPDKLSRRYCVLSGPNLAKEIAEGKPASTVVASRSPESAVQVQKTLMSPTFRVYTNNDVVGVELGGALKNIIALGSGISDGLGYGDNAKAAFMTRGLAEITRLGVAAGANPATFAGLAGLGDLVATCSSRLSRNRYVGEELAKGRDPQEVLSSMDNVAEGVYTTAAALRMSQNLGIDMPITQVTYRVLFKGLAVKQAVSELMGRPPTTE
jgi:glycerol-3-phosphate dehydrogenase (NAD(P)+)